MGQLCSCTRSQSAAFKHKLPAKPPIITATRSEPRCAPVNGYQTLPSNVTSSSCDTQNGVIARKEATVLTSSPAASVSSLTSRTKDGDTSAEVAQSPSATSTAAETEHQYHRDVISSRSTPCYDVTTEILVDYTASSSLSSAASSSLVTSDGVTSSLDCDDDVIDGGTLRRRPSATGNTSWRAHARLSVLLSQLLAVANNDDEVVAADIERLLSTVLSKPETVSTTIARGSPETGSIFELLDAVITECGLSTAIAILLDAMMRVRHVSTGGHLDHVMELLRAVELLLGLVTSLDSADAEARNYRCTCDVMRSDDAADFDVQLTSSFDCVTDDATLPRQGRVASDSRYRIRHCASTVACDDDDTFDYHLPTLSVRLSGWCLCDQQRTLVLSQLLNSTRCLCDLALVKVNLDAGLWTWLADAIRTNTSLVRLDLRLSCLGDADGAAALGDGLSRHRRLRTLNLAGTGLSDTGLCCLLSALSTNRKIVELDIGFNDFATGSGCLALDDVLRTRRPPLRRLRMRENGITWSTSTVLPFFRSTARSPRLRYLDLSGNGLGDDGVSQLSEALLVNRTLRELSIEYCQFGYNGCCALARAVRSNDSLRSLQLSRNPVGDHGFSEIAGALRYNRTLTSLGANQCHVGNAGLAHLLDALRHNVTVTLVKLCYNDIGRDRDDGTATLGRRRRGGGVILMTSLSSLQVLKDDVINDEVVASRNDDADIISTNSRADCRSAGTCPRYLAPTSTLTRCVRSSSDVTSGIDDDGTPTLTELYSRLREVLHENVRLKILLWGNKIDPWILESPGSKRSRFGIH